MQQFVTHFPEFPLAFQDVIANDRLNKRPRKQPDLATEMEMTTSVVKALRETPEIALDVLAFSMLQLTEADSAGVSLLGRLAGHHVLLWEAAAGSCSQYLGSTVRYDESPSGPVLSADSIMLMVAPGKAYKSAARISPPIREILIAPFHVQSLPVGTVWVTSQGKKSFDAEDARVIKNMSEMAALAYLIHSELGHLEALRTAVQVATDKPFSFFLQKNLKTFS
ncbi:hypothetical protein [Variovorax sp. HJSM1_2]|uniref:hypothetical protein n=1 Tax=Variovorax sp. HJSM1_2 TaxID=3366263 RepID=UPI003BD47E9E